MTAAILGTALALAVVAAVTVLGWHGTLDGQTVSGLYGAIIGLIGGGGAAVAHATAVKGKT